MKHHHLEIRIGELAKQSGLGVETLRFYEQRGLIAPSARLASGYRIYDPETLHQLHFIQRSKSLGFSLEETKQLLHLNQQVHESCHDVRGQVQQKLDSVEQRIADLLSLQRSLKDLLMACDGTAPIGACPILESLRCGKDDLHD